MPYFTSGVTKLRHEPLLGSSLFCVGKVVDGGVFGG